MVDKAFSTICYIGENNLNGSDPRSNKKPLAQ